MTDPYDDMKVTPDPALAEELRRKLRARMARTGSDLHEGGAPDSFGTPRLQAEAQLVPVKEIGVSFDSPSTDRTSRRRVMIAAAVVAIVGVAAIAGIAIRSRSDDAATASSDPATVAPTTVPPATEVPATVVPATVVPAGADAQIKRVEILGGPDWLAADDEGVWVKLDLGELRLVDPQTAAVVAQVDIGGSDGRPCQGLGIGFGSVWTCSGSDVVRIDPVTRTVQSRLALNKTSPQGHLIAHADRIWVLTGMGDTLVGVDPSTDQVVTTVTLPWRASDIAGGAAGLWAISASDGHVMQVDVESGAVLVDVAVPDAVAISVGDQVWVAAKLESVRLDPASGAVLTTIDAGAGPAGSILADGESVWVRNTTDFVTQFDADTGQPIQTHDADVVSGGDMVLAFGSLWTTAFDDSALFAIPVD